MSLSSPFISRPVATTLLTVAVALSGLAAYKFLPVAALPQIEFPTISVLAQLPGASAEVMASSVATPLERQFGRISGVAEMTSTSVLGATSITLQFVLDRDINGAARDVQAAINAARTYLPTNLPSTPTYRKVNPSEAPILILALTSKVYGRGPMYDAASTIIEQRLSQIQGVGEVIVGGNSLPAVRVELHPALLNSFGLGVTDVARALAAQNANIPKGQFSDGQLTMDILANDQLMKAEYYRKLVVGYRNGAAIRLSDVADVLDSVENVRSAGYLNSLPAVPLIIFKAPEANVINTVDQIRAVLPSLQAAIPAGIDIRVAADRTLTTRASVSDVQLTMLIAIALVVLVVFVFLRNLRATLIPSIAVPTSLIGTFGVMYLLHYSLDNLSLMALTISTGFVVDDAIVVIENITRHLEAGMRPLEAAYKGAAEIGFTVLSISTSLVAVFIPLLLMGGIVGRMLREFAVTLSVTIVISLLISLTTTPMMCSRLLRAASQSSPKGRLNLAVERAFSALVRFYGTTLAAVLRHPAVTLAVLLTTVVANGALFYVIPKGFFPQQDNGTLYGGIQGQQNISFQKMNMLTQEFLRRIERDPAVENVVSFTGGGSGATNTGFIYVGLKPLAERKISSSRVIDRLRPMLMSVPGATVFLQAGQDVRVGGRLSSAQYQYTILSENLDDLDVWGPRLLEKMREMHGLRDANTDQQNDGPLAFVDFDRATAARMSITPQLADSTLYDNFGQALVSTMYTPLNQYYVVMEAAPKYAQALSDLGNIYLHSPAGGVVPLEAIARYEPKVTPLSVNHQGLFPSVTVSFNLAPGVSVGQATAAIDAMGKKMGMPASIHGIFTGTLQAFMASLSSEKILVVTALLVVYIVLGILYESYIHPITILSTLPSAGVGALLALMLFHMDLSVVALIGVILLIGIVKKNAILMIDFALTAERQEGKSPRDAIYEACLLRVRPILMTTLAAAFGALPLAVMTGTGAELRRPLGVAIVGGLLFSQAQTLYTTPIVYLYLDGLARRWRRFRGPATAVTAALVAVLFVSGCATPVPKYQKPAIPIPQAFKEWKTAEPRDGAIREKWWEVFNDPELNDLEGKLDASNASIAQAAASFLEARMLVKETQAQLWPTLSVAPNVSVQGGQAISAQSQSVISGTFAQYSLPIDASWVPDIWGKARAQIEQNTASAQMSAADLANVRLTQQAELAVDFFELRAQDSLLDLYAATTAADRHALELTKSLAKTGIDSDEAVAQAEVTLRGAEAQETGLGIARAQYEHAIALLVGKSPADVSLARKPLGDAPPQIPVGVPSELLERRPDVAAAERSMAAANAQIGVAKAAYYPTLTLSGSAGVGGNSIQGLLSAPAFIWSLGAALAETIFDAGLRSATVDQYKAAYDAAAASYRLTVLTAFQQVEDDLAGVRILSDQVKHQEDAVTSARRYLKIAMARYRTGIDPYLNVITAQLTLLTSQQTSVTLRMQRFTTSVQLVEALGGGWSLDQLP